MTGTVDRIARLGDRMFDRLRHTSALAITEDDAIDADLSLLRGHKYVVLVTYRCSGEPVPSPVWLAVDGNGFAYVKSAANVGKVKRVQRDSRVLVVPSTMRGRPKDRPIRATARVLTPDQWPHAEKTLALAYGRGRHIAERLLTSTSSPSVYIEVVRRR